MDWKESIGEYFAKNNRYRVKYLNDKLKEYCEEYLKYIVTFNGIQYKIKDGEEIPGLNGMKVIIIKIRILDSNGRNSMSNFVLNCYFNFKGNLCLKYSIGHNGKARAIESLNRELTEKDDFYIYKEEEINEPERTEKEFIFQLFNIKLMEWIEKHESLAKF